MLSEAIETLAQNILKLEPVSNIINGVLLIAKGIGFFVFLPLKMLGIELVPMIVNLIYLGIIFYILYKLTNSAKWSGIVLFFMIIVGSVGGI